MSGPRDTSLKGMPASFRAYLPLSLPPFLCPSLPCYTSQQHSLTFVVRGRHAGREEIEEKEIRLEVLTRECTVFELSEQAGELLRSK